MDRFLRRSGRPHSSGPAARQPRTYGRRPEVRTGQPDEIVWTKRLGRPDAVARRVGHRLAGASHERGVDERAVGPGDGPDVGGGRAPGRAGRTGPGRVVVAVRVD